ncbi:MAG: DUF1464 family protein [Thermoproteota archaeon]
MRVLGIDPGTKSFDLAVVEDGRVAWERSIETARIAADPSILLEAVDEAGGVDAIAAPSGYGVPVTRSSEVLNARRLAVSVLLLSTEEEIEEGVRRGDVGALVYSALARVVETLVKRGTPESVFIPGVVHLPTVEPHAKYNRVDLGTADKLAVAVLAVYQEARRSPREANFMLLELGYGYNALMLVEKGRVVWGLGGTSLSTGMLTAGPLDLEVVALGRTWSRVDVFHGGVMEACGVVEPEQAAARALNSTGPCRDAYEAMLDSIATVVAGLYARRGVRRLLLSGRLSASRRIADDIASRLPGGIQVEKLEPLEGAEASKHAAQGYALEVEGLLGGSSANVVRHMRIAEACGTALDHVVHPNLKEAKRRVLEAYTSSVAEPKLCSGS